MRNKVVIASDGNITRVVKKGTMILDFMELKNFIDKSGLKQKTIAEKSGVPEVQLCLILQGKRKCEVGEYASICDALGVKVDRFIRKSPRMPDKTKSC